MLSAAVWVPRGFASEFPENYELDDAEMERINKLAQLEIDDANDTLKKLGEVKDQDEDSDQDGDQDDCIGDESKDATGEKTFEKNESNRDSVKSSKLKEEFEADDDLKEYDLEHYDDDTDEGIFSLIPGVSTEVEYHSGDEEKDPYISLPSKEEELEEKQEYQVYPTDNLILATRAEDNISYLDVYVYDDGAGAPPGAEEEEADKVDPDVAKGLERGSSLYMHHDLMLPAFPLCVEWINYKANQKEESDNVGNFAAIGTFDPQIEIWNLDCLEKAFPDLILGEPSANSFQSLKAKKSKKKSKKSVHVKTHHTDAVLSLSHNKFHRNILASTSADHTVKLWDLNNGIAVRSFNQIHNDKNVSSSQWHPVESSILLTGGYDSNVAISDVRIEDGSDISKIYKIGNQDIENAIWNSNDTFLAGTDQGNVYCFDIRNQNKPVWTLQAHDAGISSLQVNPHIPNLMVSSAMGEKLIKLWKLPEQNSNKGPSMVLSRDFGVGNVLTTSFAPDIEVAGNLVIGGVNAGLKLFDVFSNRSVRSLFKDSLKTLQQNAREEALKQGRASRIARKYNSDYKETVLDVESDGEEESEDDSGDDDMNDQ